MRAPPFDIVSFVSARHACVNIPYGDVGGATLDDLREAVTTLEDTARIAQRVLGGAHPITAVIEDFLRNAQETLSARETPPRGG